MARGGRRQGTPGVAYQNRTDLNVIRAPQAGTATAAAGGISAPPAAPPQQQPPITTPDMIPKLDDPTAYPDEPVTAGLTRGPGGGPEALGYVPPSPAVQTLQAAYLAYPTPELRRALMLLATKGAL